MEYAMDMYQSWPTKPEHQGCMSPDYASFCDWLDVFIEDEAERDEAEGKRLESVDRVTLWKLVQDASAYCNQAKDLSGMASKYRPDWWPCNIDGSFVYLLDMCQILHADHTGSSDPIGYVERDSYIRALEYARDNWKKPSSSYDDAVLRLVIRTLNERKPKIETPPDCIRVAVPRAK